MPRHTTPKRDRTLTTPQPAGRTVQPSRTDPIDPIDPFDRIDPTRPVRCPHHERHL